MQQKTPLTQVKGEQKPRYHLGSPLKKAASFTLSRAHPSLPKIASQQGGSGAMFRCALRSRFHLAGLSDAASRRVLFPSLPFAIFTRTDYPKMWNLSIKRVGKLLQMALFFPWSCGILNTTKQNAKRSNDMKLVSWNVNGLRAVLGKGFLDFVAAENPDILCLQETKLQPEQAVFELEGYHRFFNSADKKGYSGTAILTKEEPISVTYDFGDDVHRHEGRIITAEYPDFYLVCCYTPNSQDGLKRLDYRMQWEDDLRAYLQELDAVKPVVYCGDLNVAHEEIDIKNPKSNRKNAGFTDEERAKMTQLLSSGFADTYRSLHPDKVEYSWWSYRFNARANNAGWRIDYFVVSERLLPRVTGAAIRTDVFGSDHCPVVLEME